MIVETGRHLYIILYYGGEKMKDQIYDLYIVKGYSTRDVAAELGIGQSTVRRRMKEYGIVARTGKEAHNTKHIIEKEKKRHKSMQIREKRYCDSCGKEFYVQPHLKKKNCSSECAHASTAKKLSTKIKVKCDYCDKEIERTPSRILNNKHNFCNGVCHGKWKSENLIGTNNPQYKRIKRNCSNCGKAIDIIPSRDEHENIYCDRTCMAEHYSKTEMFSGENSPTWKGGKTTRNEYGANWLSRRREVRAREKYTCDRCGKTEDENKEELSIHHIRNFKSFDHYQKANSLENLVGLCRECHTFVHSNKNINKEYINEDIV